MTFSSKFSVFKLEIQKYVNFYSVFALLQLVRALKWLEMVIVMMKQTTYIVAVLILVTVAIHVLAQNFALIVTALLEMLGEK